jgi:trk/ktr system potassium uptake protein
MKICIIGAGEVGTALAGKLSREGNDITIVDTRLERIQNIEERFDVQAITGSGTDPDILLSAGIETADVCVAVTDSDSVNMVISLLAKAYGKKDLKKMARLRSENLLDKITHGLQNDIPVDLVIHPEVLAVRRIIDKIRYPQIDEIARFSSGKVAVAGFTLKESHSAVGQTVQQLRSIRKLPFLVAVVVRKEKAFIPNGDTVLTIGDRVYIIASVQRLGMILKACTGEGSSYREVMITGSTVLAENIALKLSREGIRVKMLVSGKKNALALAERLEDVIVLNSEPTDLSTISNEAGEKLDMFISATDGDELNVVSSLLAKEAGVSHTITVVRKRKLAHRLRSLPLGMVVSPRSLAVEHILHVLRDGIMYELDAFSPLHGARVREFTLNTNSPMCNKQIMDLTFPEETLVGAIVRRNRVFIPEGTSVLQAGDQALCFALQSSLEPLDGLFKESLSEKTRR